jgi:tricorn protease
MFAAPLDGGPVRRLTDAFGEHPTMTPTGSTVAFARGSNNGAPDLSRPRDGRGLDARPRQRVVLPRDQRRRRRHRAPPARGRLGAVHLVGGRAVQRLAQVARGVPGEQLTEFKPTAEQKTLAHGVRDLERLARRVDRGLRGVGHALHARPRRRNAEPEPIEITISGDTTTLDFARMDLDRMATEVAMSPDGQTVAIVARGEIFVRSTAEDRPTRRVTHHEARDQQIAWSPDGSTLYFVSDRDGPQSIYAATVALSRQDIEPAEEEGDRRRDARRRSVRRR